MNIVDRIDPELRAAFLQLKPGLIESVEAALYVRSNVPSGLKLATQPLGGKKRDVRVPGPSGSSGVLIRIYEPERRLRELPVFVWLHGGGYYMGDLEMEDEWLVLLSRAVNCVVVSIDYRLAPENPFPAAIEDSHAVLLWVAANALELGIDPQRIAIGGESGGGGLAAGLGLYARDQAKVPLVYQMLLSPMIDDREITNANKRIADPRLYNAKYAKVLWRFYLGEDYGSERVSPYAAAARAADLTGLPSTYIALGELDLFVDESLIYAQRCLTAGVQTEINIYPGAFHGFNRFAPEARVSRKSVQDRDYALIRALHG